MTDGLDQSALETAARRLVEAARKAGADKADAVAVRGVSMSVARLNSSVADSPSAGRRTAASEAGAGEPAGPPD